MKLSKKENNRFLLEGTGKEFKTITSQLLSQNHTNTLFSENPDIVPFYQSLLRVSKDDMTDTQQVFASDSVLVWLFKGLQLVTSIKKETEELLQDLEYQFKLLWKQKEETETLPLVDRLFIDYQYILGVSNIKKMSAFINSFLVSEEELHQMVATSFLEAYPSIQEKDIRLDMMERMYHHFFNQYESLLVETHLLYPFPVFKEQLIQCYEEETQVQIHSKEIALFIGVYLLYFDMFLKGLEDGFVYQAENEHMLFDWFKPLFIKIATQQEELLKAKEKREENLDKDMLAFRDIYIEEISKVLPGVEKIENDKEIPYNVVFILKGNQKVVSNTLKHYQGYIQEEIKGHGKERVRSMREYIQKIAPIQKQTNSANLFQQSFEDVKKHIYPMIRLISTSPEEAVYTHFVDGLGVYYGVRLQSSGKTQYGIIMKRMMEKWEISIDVLKATAFTNLQQCKPSFVTYYEMLEQKLSEIQLQQVPRAYKEVYFYAGKSSIDSSYVLDKETLDDVKQSLQTDTLILSMPLRDCLLITKKEHYPLLNELTVQLYESSSAKLMADILIESEGEWKVMQ